MFIGYLVFAPILIAPVLYRIGRKNAMFPAKKRPPS